MQLILQLLLLQPLISSQDGTLPPQVLVPRNYLLALQPAVQLITPGRKFLLARHQVVAPGVARHLPLQAYQRGATIRLQIAPTNFQRVIIDNGLDANRLTQVEQWGSTAWTSMQSAFYDCQNLQITATDVPNLSGVTNMEEMFSGCITLNSPSNMGSWNTATVTNMRFLFYGTTAFNQNIGGWNTGAVTNMSTMFSEGGCF